MRIQKVRIQNFRSFKDETIEFNKYTCFVGPNGAGKSTVLAALNVFFRESRDVATNLQQLGEEDFHAKNTTEPIQITVTFSELSVEAREAFKHYFRQGCLTVTSLATFDPGTKRAAVEQHGERLVMAEFTKFFEALNAKALVVELRALYAELKGPFGLAEQSTKGGMEEELRDYEESHPGKCTLIRSPANFYGFSKGDNLLQRYIEWIYVPAVKDASSEQVEGRANTFGRLVARAVRTKVEFSGELKQIRDAAQERYRLLLEANGSALDELSQMLQLRVSQWAHPGARVELKWDQMDDTAVSIKDPLVRILASEGAFLGELPRFGHGLQRSYLLALLHELSSSKGAAEPTLLLACEEPELYQHPPQARHLATVLADLSEQGSQILVSTHCPYFVSGEAFEDVRVVRKNFSTGEAAVNGATYEQIAARIGAALSEEPKKRAGAIAQLHRSLQPSLNEIFFGSRIILVEGIEDCAYITSYLHLKKSWDEFRRRGIHIVSADGKGSMLRPLVAMLELQIPVFVVFDSDSDEMKDAHRKLHERDNVSLLRALGANSLDPFPTEPVWGNNFVQWDTCLSDRVELDVGKAKWAECQQTADKDWDHCGGLRKNPLHIAATLSIACKQIQNIPSLDILCSRILESNVGGTA